jgi:calcium permeable stress-gated cation channel
LLVVITLGYSIISPIINGLACGTFFLFYMMYKYLFLWVYKQPSTSDTGGLFFPKAIQHIFVGMYVQQVCLAALFFLARDQNKKAGAVPEGALMVVLIVLTVCLFWYPFVEPLLKTTAAISKAFFNLIINHSYGPLLHALPLSLADKTYKSPSIPHQDVGEEASPLTGKSSTSIEESDREPKPTDKAPAPLDTSSKAKTEDDYGFAHPAISRPQRTVWLPKDTLGLGDEEVTACRDAGVDVSSKDAMMDGTGKVDISGGPPDLIREEWRAVWIWGVLEEVGRIVICLVRLLTVIPPSTMCVLDLQEYIV